ncbi:MAG: radical SAM protein [Candidatus Omnitrophica bacterium]|nr:radical SAM protein [Candidatus Omnitrophota bacterium]
MQKILLIDPPYRYLYGKSQSATEPYFPLGLGYIAAVLRRAGIDCQMLVDIGKPDFLNTVMETVKDYSPSLVGLTAMTTNYPNAVRVAETIKKAHSIPVVIGGAHASACGSKILSQEQGVFDFVIMGEGEDTMVELASAINLGQVDLSAIKGLAWRSNKGQIMKNGPRPLNEEPDSLPFPARDMVDLSFFSIHSHIGGGNAATMLTSRGCPYRCIFCSAHTVSGRRYRQHSADYVLAEMEELVNKYKVKYIFIQDDTFTIDRGRLERICEEIRKRKLGIKFGCFSRVDIMDQKTAAMLKQAGLVNVVFGIESGDEGILKKIRKQISLKQVHTAIRSCESQGIKTLASFVIGLPFDTKETLERTIKFALSLNPTLVAFNPLVPFPGSDIFDENTHSPVDISGWSRYLTVNVPPFSFVEGLTPQEIYNLAQSGHRRFYLRPGQIWRILKTVRHISDVKEMMRAGFVILTK